MKKLILSISFISLLIIGCQDSKTLNLVEPDHSEASLNKNDNLFLINDAELIKIDLEEEINIISTDDSIVSVSKYIDPVNGGWISLEADYNHPSGKIQRASAYLQFPPGAILGTDSIEITLGVNFKSATFSFSPHGLVFGKALGYNVGHVKFWGSFSNLDLNEFNFIIGERIDFVYFRPDGSIELIKEGALSVNPSHLTVQVYGANLLHFSRYGWVKRY